MKKVATSLETHKLLVQQVPAYYRSTSLVLR